MRASPILLTLAITSALLGTVLPALAAPTAKAYPLEGTLRLGGIIDEPAWTNLPWVTNFVSASAGLKFE